MPIVVEQKHVVAMAPTASAMAPKVATSGKPSMAVINFWLDAALFINVVVTVWITVMLRLVFPAPTEAADWRLWGLSFNAWNQVQFGSIGILGLLVVEHLALHWNWVCTVLATRILRRKNKPDEGVQAIYGVGFFISVLLASLGLLIAALVGVRAGI